MALLNLGDDPWLLEHQSCEKLHGDIMEQLSLRQKELKHSEAYSRLSASIRQRLKQYNNEITELKKNLDTSASRKLITNEETERRSRQVEVLQSKHIQMQRLFNDEIMNTNRDRERLIGGRGISQISSANWGTGDDDEMINVASNSRTADDLRRNQSRLLEDQENSLEALSKVISRQKDIAQTISNEVDIHNDILEDLGDHVERTDMRVRGETNTIGMIDTKDRTCWYWIIIIGLFVAIMVVSLI